MKPTEKEIEDAMYDAAETAHDSQFPSMTYEQGVVAALEWVLGMTDSRPMED